MSDETHAVDGANTAAPVESEATKVAQQETSAAPAEAENSQDAERDEQGRFTGRKVQERINELTRARREAERRAEYAETLLNQQTRQPAPASSELPAFENFNDINAWGKAIAEQAARSAREVAAQEFSQRQQQAQQAQVFGNYEAQEREYSAKNPGYADAFAALQSSVRFDPVILEVIADSSSAPAIVHYLGEHLDAADRIQRLPPHKAAAEIARIEARVNAPRKPPVSSAPAPAPSLGGGSAASKEPDRMTVDEWLAWRQSQLKK